MVSLSEFQSSNISLHPQQEHEETTEPGAQILKAGCSAGEEKAHTFSENEVNHFQKKLTEHLSFKHTSALFTEAKPPGKGQAPPDSTP